jgi:hypothetical protein
MSADGGHLGWRSGSQDIILKVDHRKTIHAMFTLNSTKLAINVHWMVLYQICVFGVDRKFNMAARANNVF